MTLVLLAASLHAQTPPDSAPHRFRLDAARLQPGQYTYQLTIDRGGPYVTIGTRTVTVSPAQYASSPVWLLLETRTGDRISAADSLFTSVTDLRPIHWSSTQNGARLAAEFVGDSLLGGTSGPPGRRSIVTPAPYGTLVNSAMLETALRLLPLQSGWQDSTTTLSITLGTYQTIPTQLAVVGEDRIRTPTGSMADCWVVSVHAGDASAMYWVTKRDPVVVKSTQELPSLGGALVSLLVR